MGEKTQKQMAEIIESPVRRPLTDLGVNRTPGSHDAHKSGRKTPSSGWLGSMAGSIRQTLGRQVQRFNIFSANDPSQSSEEFFSPEADGEQILPIEEAFASVKVSTPFVTGRSKARRRVMQTRVASPPSNSTHCVDTLEKAQAAVTASSEDQATASTTEGGDNESVVSESPQLDPAIERLSSCIDTIRGGGRVRTRTRHGKKKLQREELVASVIKLFSKISERELGGQLAICFEGEEAIDAGGVSNEMFTQFFITIFDPEIGFFEARSGGSTMLPAAAEKYTKARLVEFEAIGKVLVKAVLDRVPVPRGIAAGFFAFMRGDQLTNHLLAEFDPVMARSVEMVLQMETEEDVECLCLSFPDDEDRDVTLENRAEFVEAMGAHHILGCRAAAMQAVIKGMQALPKLFACLVDLPLDALQDAICGASVIDHTAIAAHLYQEEAEFGSRGEEPQQQMRQLLQLWSQQELQLFLAFTTGVANLQPNGSMINADATPKHKIKLQRCLCSACKPKQQSPDLVCCNLPVASTCFWTLRLPNCASVEELQQRFSVAFTWANGSFGEL